MQGEGIQVHGFGRKELYEEFVVHANGMEWDVVVTQTVTGGPSDHEWWAQDKRRFDAWQHSVGVSFTDDVGAGDICLVGDLDVVSGDIHIRSARGASYSPGRYPGYSTEAGGL